MKINKVMLVVWTIVGLFSLLCIFYGLYLSLFVYKFNISSETFIRLGLLLLSVCITALSFEKFVSYFNKIKNK